jgi:hypothetical protein
MIERKRKIAIRDFRGPGQHVYEDELGFSNRDFQEARTLVPREAFRFHVENIGLNMAFYYPNTDTFYGIHTESIPVKVKILPRHREWSDFVGWQCESDTHDDGEVIAVFNSASEIWDNLRIDNKPFEEVLRNSYITALN